MKKNYIDLLAEMGIGGAHPGGITLTQHLFSELTPTPEASILEIGCGTGQTAQYLAETFHCSITAIDNHPVMVQRAKERLKHMKVDVQYGEGENLTFNDEQFDMVIAESVITFTSSILSTLQEILRVLKEESVLMAIEMVAQETLTNENKNEISHLYGIKKILTESEWIERFRAAGFSSVSILDTSKELTKTVITDIRPSETISEELYDIWDSHHEYLSRPNIPLSFRVFLCQK